MDQESKGRGFTGRHMALILVAFFGVVIVVNVAMARLAVTSFGGTVVDNSYVASQHYNKWLEQGRRASALGWTPVLARTADDRLSVTLSGPDRAPLSNALLSAIAQHPLGQADDHALTLHEIQPGLYISDTTLPKGRWQVNLDIKRSAQSMRTMIEVK